jgi:hypothetical protein
MSIAGPILIQTTLQIVSLYSHRHWFWQGTVWLQIFALAVGLGVLFRTFGKRATWLAILYIPIMGAMLFAAILAVSAIVVGAVE